MRKDQSRMWLPPFLNNIHLTESDIVRLDKHMGNWIKVHAHITTLPHTPRAVDELKLMLAYELRFGKRLDVLHRLFRRMSLIRRDLEEGQLFGKRT